MMMAHDWPRPDQAHWRTLAACAGMDPDDFHPDKGHSHIARNAKAVCATCPVQADCLAFAMDNDIYDGIYGGLAPRERGAMRPQRNRPQNSPQPINHGTEGGARTHRRRGEDPCDACRDAENAARRERERRAS